MDLRKILRKPKKEKTPPSDFKKLKLLVTVVNRGKTEFFIDLIASLGVNLQTSVNAKGTAKSEALSVLGLEESDKSVIFSVVNEDKAEAVMRAIDERFQKLRGGKKFEFLKIRRRRFFFFRFA